MTETEAPIEVTFRTRNLSVRDAGAAGLIVAVDDGRGEDWPAAHVEGREAERLRAFLGRGVTVPDRRGTETFSAWLDAACGGKHHTGITSRLARWLGVTGTCVSFWRLGTRGLPTEAQVRRIADFFHAHQGLILRLWREQRGTRGRGRERQSSSSHAGGQHETLTQ